MYDKTWDELGVENMSIKQLKKFTIKMLKDLIEELDKKTKEDIYNSEI